MFEQNPNRPTCPAIDGLIEEANEMAGEVADKPSGRGDRGVAQAVEHYGIARYGTLVAWADELGRDESFVC